jgi:hypothetical protein
VVPAVLAAPPEPAFLEHPATSGLLALQGLVPVHLQPLILNRRALAVLIPAPPVPQSF